MSRFVGLMNKGDPLRIHPEEGIYGLSQAVNCEIDDSLKIRRATGFAQVVAGAFSSIYATRDEERLYAVSGDTLYSVTEDGNGVWSTLVLKTGLADSVFHWTEVSGRVYATNGTDYLVIEPQGTVRDWGLPVPEQPVLAVTGGELYAGTYRVALTYRDDFGRESGARNPAIISVPDNSAISIAAIPQMAGLTVNVYISPTNGPELYYALETDQDSVTWNGPSMALAEPLRTRGLQPPCGDILTLHEDGRIYISEYEQTRARSIIYRSQQFDYELFDMLEDADPVPGRILMLGSTPEAVIVGTESRIYALSDEGIVMLADYGVPAGHHLFKDDDGKVLFWSDRGLCEALPFRNRIDRAVSVNKAEWACGTVVEQSGFNRYITVLDEAGSPRNAYAQS